MLGASGSGIKDLAGNNLALDATVSWRRIQKSTAVPPRAWVLYQ
jgi:hypothetical protein